MHLKTQCYCIAHVRACRRAYIYIYIYLFIYVFIYLFTYCIYVHACTCEAACAYSAKRRRTEDLFGSAGSYSLQELSLQTPKPAAPSQRKSTKAPSLTTDNYYLRSQDPKPLSPSTLKLQIHISWRRLPIKIKIKPLT